MTSYTTTTFTVSPPGAALSLVIPDSLVDDVLVCLANVSLDTATASARIEVQQTTGTSVGSYATPPVTTGTAPFLVSLYHRITLNVNGSPVASVIVIGGSEYEAVTNTLTVTRYRALPAAAAPTAATVETMDDWALGGAWHPVVTNTSVFTMGEGTDAMVLTLTRQADATGRARYTVEGVDVSPTWDLETALDGIAYRLQNTAGFLVSNAIRMLRWRLQAPMLLNVAPALNRDSASAINIEWCTRFR